MDHEQYGNERNQHKYSTTFPDSIYTDKIDYFAFDGNSKFI